MPRTRRTAGSGRPLRARLLACPARHAIGYGTVAGSPAAVDTMMFMLRRFTDPLHGNATSDDFFESFFHVRDNVTPELIADMSDGALLVNFQGHANRAILTHEGVTEHATINTLRDLALTVRVDTACALWPFPLETVTMSEAGYERGYQGTVYLHVWTLHLEPDAEWQGSLTVEAAQRGEVA